MGNTGMDGFPGGIRVTCGEVLPGGKVIELVRSSGGDKVNLLFWDGEKSSIALQIQHDGVIYQAPYLHSTLLRAVTFPAGLADYGTAWQLFWKIVGLFHYYVGLDEAMRLTYVLLRSWVSEPAPLTVCILGDRAQLTQLRRLCHALSHLPLALAELTRNLRFELHSTLLINSSWVSAKAARFWLASNSPDVYVAGTAGTVSNIACTKIIFGDSEEQLQAWGTEALHIALLPTAGQLPPLTEAEERKIAAEFQPQLLQWRLDRLTEMQQSGPASCPANVPGGTSAQNLLLCVGEEPEIVQALRPLLEAQEQELSARRSRDPRIAIVESIWSPSHQEKEISTAEITKRLNALLRNRGETLVYNSHQIGWKLNQLGLERRHNGKQKVMLFSRETRSRIHQLAAQFGLQLPKVAKCPDCKDAQLIVGK